MKERHPKEAVYGDLQDITELCSHYPQKHRAAMEAHTTTKSKGMVEYGSLWMERDLS